MKSKSDLRLFHTVVLINIVWLAHGCGYDDRIPPHLVKTEAPTNTFRMYPHQRSIDLLPKDRICTIRIYDGNDVFRTDRPFYWEVRAVEPVLANGFEVVAGVVPDGFVQIVPPPDQMFIAVAGTGYYIAVDLAEPERIPWIQTYWVAD